MKLILPILALLMTCVGCESEPASESQTRLNAAMLIKSDTSRHNALIACAENAAECGDGDVVIASVAQLEKKSAGDNVLAKCSRILANNGNSAMAAKVAELIERETARENALEAIATTGNRK